MVWLRGERDLLCSTAGMVYPEKHLVQLVRQLGQASPKGGGASATTQEVFPSRPVRETAANPEEGLYFVILKIHRTG